MFVENISAHILEMPNNSFSISQNENLEESVLITSRRNLNYPL